MSGTDHGAPRYGVVGHPVEHSLSPEIHAAFGRQTGVALDYRRIEAAPGPGPDGFAATIARFFADGGRGLNVTVPFKLDACAACGDRVSARAALAGAVNTLCRTDAGIEGDNTDGAGLVADLARLLAPGSLVGADVLLAGAGGAARGVLAPLFDAGIDRLTIVNRDAAKAAALAIAFAPRRIDAASFENVDDATFDVVVNATSAGLDDDAPPLAARVLARARLVYDMTYGARSTRFVRAARDAGAACVEDGLGMLVEQAAASFAIWHGVRPKAAPVLAALRAELDRRSGR